MLPPPLQFRRHPVTRLSGFNYGRSTIRRRPRSYFRETYPLLIKAADRAVALIKIALGKFHNPSRGPRFKVTRNYSAARVLSPSLSHTHIYTLRLSLTPTDNVLIKFDKSAVANVISLFQFHRDSRLVLSTALNFTCTIAARCTLALLRKRITFFRT